MTNVELARVVGTFALILSFLIKGVILSRQSLWLKYGRAAGIWIVVYIYFLIVLRVFTIFHWATTEQLTIVSGWSAVIVLCGIILHIMFRGREDKPLIVDENKK